MTVMKEKKTLVSGTQENQALITATMNTSVTGMKESTIIMGFNCNNLADRLRLARTRRHFTKKELSEKSGISYYVISAYESKKEGKGENPLLNNIIAIAKGLDVSLDWLCGFFDNEDTLKNREMFFLYKELDKMDNHNSELERENKKLRELLEKKGIPYYD